MTASTTHDDHRWMALALRQAVRSLGRTAPNPGVGCVLARQGVLVGTGRHERCGGPHAEVQALADARRRGNDTTGATAYITLAPCTTHGRTPPCTDALIAARVARVVAAIADPVQDDAQRHLTSAGIAYHVGCLGAIAQHIHGGFLTRVRLGRPRFTAKWAMTLDGCIAAATGDSRWISSIESRGLSRRRRRAYDGILVGARTAKHDDPVLLAQPVRDGRTPTRIVLSDHADLSVYSRLVQTLSDAPVLVVHGRNADRTHLNSLQRAGVTTLDVGHAHEPEDVAVALGRAGFNDVLIEGGAVIHGAWLRADLVDRVEAYIAPRTLGGGQGVAAGQGAATIGQGEPWVHESPPRLLGDTLWLRLRRSSAGSAR